MGYYVRIVNANIYIPASIHGDICKHLHDSGFLTNTDSMRGGSYSDGKCNAKWYSWVNMETLAKHIHAGDLAAVFRSFGFDVSTLDGNIIDLHYDNKTGDEIELFKSIAPALPGIHWVEFVGEGSEHYRYYIKNRKFHEIYGDIVFEEPQP